MMKKLMQSFLVDMDGATAVEYGLLAALLSISMIVGLSSFGDSLNNTFMTLNDAIKSAK